MSRASESRGSRAATAIAHPNIALAKYWGKRDGDGNYPAVPSLSVTLAGLATRTRVELRDDEAADRLILNGEPADARALARATELLDRVREAAGTRARAVIETANDFPTASGLASSASGFAALAVAAVRAAGLDWGAERSSDLARRSSASAARSLFGGFVELDARLEPGDAVLAARPVAPVDHLPLRILVCVATRRGQVDRVHRRNARHRDGEPVPRRVDRGGAAHLLGDESGARRAGFLGRRRARGAERARDARERDRSRARLLERRDDRGARGGARAKGAGHARVYATIDAGPHVKVITRPEDAALAGTWMRAVPGVLRVIECEPGEGARVVGEGESGEERGP